MSIYRDPSQPIAARVEDLLAQMTLEEKAAQLSCIMPHMLIGEEIPDPNLMRRFMRHGLGRMTQFASIFINEPQEIARFANRIQQFALEETRLGIPLLFQNEALNGFTAVKATNFPTPIALASTWEPEQVEQAAIIIRRQMRASGVHQALAPVIDLAQDPRWGRGHETFGEDPYLSSAFGAAFVRGLQGDDATQGIISCAKHFLGYSIPMGGLNMAAVRIGPRELYETFARPFETAIHESDLGAIMVTYSEIDGKPVGTSKELLRDLLRDTMGFTGSVICDGGSIEITATKQHVARDMEEAAVLAIEAGLDADTPMTEAYHHLPAAVRKGLVNERYIDEAVRRVLTAKFRLGLFENPYVDEEKTRTVFDIPEANARSRRLAERAIVLVKNENGLLPLKTTTRIALIGPHADSIRDSLFAGYSFPVALEMIQSLMKGGMATMQGVADKIAEDVDAKEGESKGSAAGMMQQMARQFGRLAAISDIDAFIREEYGAISLREALEQRGVQVRYAQGCGLRDTSTDGFAEAVAAAEQADVVIMALGGKSGWGEDATCGEGRDATDIGLPGVQQQLLETIYAAGKPIVLVIFDGRPTAIPWAAEHIPAILYAWFPGQAGSEALASVLFGEVNPGGKLPVTVPRSAGQVPIFYYHKTGSGYKTLGDAGIASFLGSGYLNEPATPLFPFGHGLSYTQFQFSDLQIAPAQVDSRGSVEIACMVENVGETAGSEVVQLYLHDREARVTRPVQELAGFKRVDLQPGERKRVTFTIAMNQLGFYNEDMRFVVEPGMMDVLIGTSSEDIRLRGEFEITGQTVEVLKRRSYLSRVQVSEAG